MKQKSGSKKRKKSRRSKLLIVSAVIILLIVIALLVVFVSPLFAVREIDIAETEHISEADIAAYLDKYMGRNGLVTVLKNSSLRQKNSFFSLRLSEVEDEILFDHAYLEAVTVKFEPKHTLRVELTERKASFLTEYYDIFLLCDIHGIVLDTFTSEDVPDDMPLVKGIMPEGYKLGRSISDGKDRNIDAAIKICGLMTQLDMMGYVDIVDVSDYSSIRMYCAPSLTIILGSPDDVGVRLSLLKGTMDDGLNGNSDGTLTLVDGKKATFVKNSERGD
ncbi:MAG: hypothetical protein J6X19_05015 [Clostridia bacterium]|nr:hypothetical protein [Clostridia bacterium]